MPIVYEMIPEVNTHVIYPITRQIVDNFLTINNLMPIFDEKMYIHDENRVASNTNGNNNNVKLIDNRLDVTVVPIFKTDENKWDTNNFKNTPGYGLSKVFVHEDMPIFVDKKRDIWLQTQMVNTTINLSLDMKFKEKTLTYTILEGLINRYGPYPSVEYNSVLYTIPMPIGTLLRLNRLYNLSDLKKDMTFKRYLELGSGKDITYARNRNNTDTEIVICMNNFRVLTEISIVSSKPESEMANRMPSDQHINVEISYQISRPNHMALVFPVVIDNNPIPEELVPVAGQESVPNVHELIRTDRAHQGYHWCSFSSPTYPDRIYRLPKYDDWNVPTDRCHHHKLGYKDIFIGSVYLDKDDQLDEIIDTKINLNDISYKGEKLNRLILDAFRLQGSRSLYNDGLFIINVYANDTRLDPSLLEFDKDLNLTIKARSHDKRYHLVISEATKISTLNQKLIPLILVEKEFFGATILLNLKELVNRGILNTKKDLIYVNDRTRIRTYTEPKHDPYSPGLGPTDDGMSYDELTGFYNDMPEEERVKLIGESIVPNYKEETNNYLFTDDGYPILFDTGGKDGFNMGQRISRIIVRSK